MMIEDALKSVNAGITQQIKVLTSARGLSANALAFNELCKSKELLEGMLLKAVNYTCEHCGEVLINKGMFSRWHGDNCKMKK